MTADIDALRGMTTRQLFAYARERQLPLPPVPPPPKLSRAKRRTLARKLLCDAGCAVTPEQVDALAPFVGRFPANTAYGHRVIELVRQGIPPSLRHVLAASIPRIERREQRMARQRFLAARVSPQEKAQLLDLLSVTAAERGTGPTWSEVRKSMDWSREKTEAVLYVLRATGQVNFSLRPGSLRRLAPSASDRSATETAYGSPPA